MKNTRKEAQLRYLKKEDGREGYAINILDNSTGEWGLDTWYPLVEKKNGDGGTDFVHWTILLKLSQLQQCGYDIDLVF